MSLRVIGAGVGRTGTTSLKLALEHLLGGACYHMYEVFQHPDHIPRWHAIVRGGQPDWNAFYDGYVATVDWPGAAFWRPLHEAYPDALVLLSVRDDPASWFRSVDATINELMMRRPQRNARAWHAMATELLATTFTAVPFDERSATAAYERHNGEVRATVSAERLLEWRVSDGWRPLCERLGLPVPDEPFPHLNTVDDYRDFLERLPASESFLQRLRRLVRR